MRKVRLHLLAHRAALGPLVIILALLGFASGASAFQTRTPLELFGPSGPGSCAGSSFATGSGDLTAATGSGDLTILAEGLGNLTQGSATITNVTTNSGSFTVGAPISASGIPRGATITAVGATTLTISQPAVFTNSSGLKSGSPTITNVANAAAFAVGWTISGQGIPEGTTITAVGANTLTLSDGVTGSRSGSGLIAGSTQIDNVNTSCGAFAVGQTIIGPGIPARTKITAVGANALTLSTGATAAGSGIQLTAWPTFAGPKSLAFDQASDRLYVLDDPSGPSGGQQPTLDVFDAATLTQITPGAFPILLPNARQGNVPLGVDNTSAPSAGHVFYNDSEDTYGYDSAGTPLGGNFPVDVPPTVGKRCGAAVDSAGNVWLSIDSTASPLLERYDASGNSLGTISIPSSIGAPCGLAFDSNDDLYVAISSQTASRNGVWRFSAADGYTTRTQITSSPTGVIAFDRAAQTLYAAESVNSSSTPERISAYDTAGNQLYRFGLVYEGIEGLAVDEGTGRVFVSGRKGISDSSGQGIGELGLVRVYGSLADFADADTTPQAADNLTTTSADLHATINDNNALPTRWSFQVSKDSGVTWAKACPPGNGGVTPGGQSGLAVSCTAFSLQSGTDYLFRVETDKGAGSSDVFSSTLGFQTEALPPASATLQSATNVTSSSADLHATIDDNNAFPTNWRFQLSKDGTTWADTKVSGKTAGNQSGVAVSGTAGELDPNTVYHFRIATSKGAGSVDTNFGDLTFTTLTAPPVVANVGSYAITDTTAYLAGEVNPRNAQTSYRFQYGTSPGALDSSTPEADIGSGLEDLVVAQPIAELAPDTDYYFKLVATSAAGTTESEVFSLHTRAGPLPNPDDRAYEMVSPPEKNFADAGALGGGAAQDGQALFFGAYVLFGEPPGQTPFVFTSYVSRRGPAGWRTRWPGETECYNPQGASTFLFSPNLDRVVISRNEPTDCPLPPLDPDAPDSALDPGHGKNYYLGDYRTEPPSYQLLTPQLGGINEIGGGEEIAADLSHVAYGSYGEQTADSPVGSFTKLYDWQQLGSPGCDEVSPSYDPAIGACLSLLSRDPSNAPFTTDSSVLLQGPNVVSATGDRIFFSNAGEVYMRQGGTTTYDVSASECTSSCDADGSDSFRGATPVGNKALIMSDAKLTNDDNSPNGRDLYLYTHSSNPATQKNLTLLSKDSEPADGTASDVQGEIGMSDDGETAFFVANGQLIAGAPIEPGPKIYRWRRNGGSPTLDYLGTLVTSPLNGVSRITPDGAYLFLYTTNRLDPGADHDADRDLYRWGAQNGWACLSCQLPGTPSAGDSPTLSPGDRGYAFSDDGQRAFFSTRDALVPQDINGKADVYEWHDGALSLISTGIGSGDSTLTGAGGSGQDVFFATRERLVGWDVDDNLDIYDARVGGGFPEPPPEGAPCDLNSGACEGAPSSAPVPVGAGSAAFEGPGNQPPAKGCPKGKSRRHGRCVASKPHHKKRQHRRAKHERRAPR